MPVRYAREADLPEILRIYAPYVENTAISFEYAVPSEAEFLTRFRGITARFPWLVWEENGQVLGYAYGSAPFERAAYRWCAEVSVYLRPDARRRGIGSSLYAALEAILAKQGFRVAYALVTSANAPSIAFHKHLGYTPCAFFQNCGFKQGQWHSVTWLEKPLNTVEIPMDFPIPFPSFVDNDRK